MIDIIENAILARLKAAGDKNVLKYKFSGLTTYPDNWDQWIKGKVINFPAAWVVYGGGDGTAQTGFIEGLGAKVDGSFVVVVAAQNSRDEQSSRHGGATGEIGAYQLITDVIGLLNGHTCGIDISPMMFRGVKLVRPNDVIVQQRLSVWALHFRTDYIVPIIEFEPDDEFVGDLHTLVTQYDPAPKNGDIALSQETILMQETN